MVCRREQESFHGKGSPNQSETRAVQVSLRQTWVSSASGWPFFLYVALLRVCPNRTKVTSEGLLLSLCLLDFLYPGWLLSSVLAASQLSISRPPDVRPYVGRTQSPKDTAAQKERHGEQVLKDWLAKLEAWLWLQGRDERADPRHW